ncbi:MAG: response regulator transcription factor [Candidatus Brocadiaceae bacterium]|jgi:DNA-binding NarL/FixJ family response regulator
MSIRILLADDHRLMRHGLRSLIQGEPDMEVIGEAENGRSAVRLAEELAPDVIVMDVAMPDLNGIEATRQVKDRTPAIEVLALSMHSDGPFVVRMLEAGAAGYLLKDTAFEQLATAIREVSAGRKYLCPEVTGPIVEDYLRRLSEPEAAATPLSPREREVLQLLAEGMISKQIASELNISVKTIETHRSRLMKKLGIRSVAELTKYAIRHGITSLEE